MNDRDVIDAFVAYLGDHGFSGLQVDRRPDEENRESEDIDAIAGPFAIEHTSIDTLPNQRRDSDWFNCVVGNLGEELIHVLNFRLKITLAYDAVSKGQNWVAIRAALKSWIINEGYRLPEGPNSIESVPGIPFSFYTMKWCQRPPGLFFARFVPGDDTLPMRIQRAFERKANKLVKYQAPGVITILLVENDDIALMNNEKMLEAIQRAFPIGLPMGINQVWYADTSIPSTLEFEDFTLLLQKRG